MVTVEKKKKSLTHDSHLVTSSIELAIDELMILEYFRLMIQRTDVMRLLVSIVDVLL